MQQVFEPLFHVFYLVTIMILGFLIIKKSAKVEKRYYYLLFGLMAIILGVGDAFHLIPRSYALLTTGLDNYPVSLGLGKLVTSITATIFYLLLFEAWKVEFNIKNKKLDAVIIALTTIRIVMCLFPQNKWFINDSPISWGIYRNIPFILLGVIIVYLLASEGIKQDNKAYVHISIAVILSFLFYIPVVLFAQQVPLVGLLMIPKTICYVWIIVIIHRKLTQQLTLRS